MSLVNCIGVRSRTLGAIIVFLSFVSPSSAQSTRFDVTGVVTDSAGVTLSGATVVALTQVDSVLTKFAITNREGAFKLRRVPAGNYILQVTFVGFQSHVHNFSLTDSALDVGTIALAESVSELGKLVVSSEHIPIVVKKDTIEYNAAAFAMRPNAVVEDLLRRLPGIEVESDGSIKAQGETVRQVLVDGKEFFGGDPKIATRNLPADAVDKVQVYDKLSDMAEFTGIDDGEEQKTINLELKDDAKKGFFGNMTGGLGNSERYDAQLSINRFSPTTQLSLIGNINNVNRQGFSFSDYLSFMGGIGAISIDGGQIGGSVPLGSDISDGFSETLAIGLNASRDFGSRTSVRSSYFLSSIEKRQNRTVQQQQLLGSNLSSLAHEVGNQQSDNLAHRLNLNVKHEIEKGHDIQLRSNFTASTSSLTNDNFRKTLGPTGLTRNTSQTRYLSDGNELGGNASLTYRKRLNSKGRSFVAEVRANLNDSDVSGDLDSETGLFDLGDVVSYSEIIQLQSRLGNTLGQTQRISLSEPLGGGSLLELRAQRRSIREDQTKTVFDRFDGSSILNESLSSGLERTYTYYRGGLNYRKNWKDVSLGFGADVQRSSLEGTVAGVATSVSRGFTHVLPSANLRYSLTDGAQIYLRYTASTREPSMNELQPFPDNSDPLNVYVGNPDLTPEYRHNATLNFNWFDQFTFTNLFAYINASYTNNKIARSRTIDEQFRQRVTSVNTGGDWTFNGQVNFGTPIRAIGARINLSNSGMYNRGLEFINGEENRSDILRNTVSAKLDNRNKDFFDVSVGARYTFNVVKYSLNQELNQNYVTRTYTADATVYLGDAWQLSASMDYRAYSQDVFGQSTNIPLLGAKITRSILNQRADIQLVGLDLLDRNEGINFSNFGNLIQEERIASLGRYVMLKFVYRLSGVGGRDGGPRAVMISSPGS